MSGIYYRHPSGCCHLRVVPGYEGRVTPVVVIDPEDWTSVDPLADALYGKANSGERHMVRDALRSLVTPPKPPEPTGLGAVVEDSHGEVYVQVEPLGRVWRCARTANTFLYADIAAVKVLSEGVSPS